MDVCVIEGVMGAVMSNVSGNLPGETQGDGDVRLRSRPALRVHDRSAADSAPPGAGTVDPSADRMVARIRWMMIISAFTTAIAIATVVGVIGYRMFASGASAPVGDGIVLLPKGARIISSSANAGRIVLTLDIGGATEIRTFDIKTLKQTGRLRFATEP
jgi:hypothetical protein